MMTSHGDLVGRATELGVLEHALAAAADGRPATVVLGGEAGVGKTAVVRACSSAARSRGVCVLAGACVDLGAGELPYLPFVEALRALVRQAGEGHVRALLGPDHASMAPIAPFLGVPAEPGRAGRDARVHLFEGVLRLLHSLGTERPVVLVCEDAHWADRSTLDLLAFLVRMLSDERLLVVVTYRTNDLHPGHPLRRVLAEFDRSRRVAHVRLPPFDHDESVAFMIRLMHSPPDADRWERTIALADGNAFFLEELVASGAATGDLDRGRIPATLRDVLLARLEMLGAEALEVLRAAAAAGRQVGHRLLSLVCDLPERDLLAALRECTDRHLLTAGEEPDRYAFRHALVREAVYADLLPGERMRLHAALATALSREESPAGELAHHWHRAGDREQAFVASLRAGAEAAAATAFAESHLQYERALQLWAEVAGPQQLAGMPRAEILRRAADAARWSGHLELALSRAEAALDEVPPDDPVGRAALLERLGRYRWETGDSAGTLRAYAEADALLAALPPSALRARVHADLATTHLRNGRYALGRRLAAEAVAMARAVGAVAEEGQALNPMGIGLTMTGDPDGGVAAIRRSVEIARAGGHLDDLHRAYVNLTFVLANIGRRAAALEAARHGLEHVRRLGLEWTAGGVLISNAAILEAELGQWEDAERTAAAALEHPLPLRSTLYLRLLLAGLAIARGRPGQAEQLIASVQEAAGRLEESEYSADIHSCLAELAIWRGDHRAARRAIADGLHAVTASEDAPQVLRLCVLGLRAEADEAQRLAALGRRGTAAGRAVRETARQVSARAEAQASGAGTPPLLPDVPVLLRQCRAELLRAEGADDAGEWAWVAEAWRGLDRPYPAAYGYWRQAEAMLATAEPDRRAATSALRAGRDIALALGADCLLRELEALARRARIDPVATPPPAAAPAREEIPFHLTRRELQVLQEIGRGLSNRRIARELFIAEKTASVHVSNILTKLGVASRGEAAAMAYRAGLIPRDDRPPEK